MTERKLAGRCFTWPTSTRSPWRGGQRGRGAEIQPEALDIAWIETTTFHGEPLRASDVRALATAGALVAARSLREGRALRQGDLRLPYAVDNRRRRAHALPPCRRTPRRPMPRASTRAVGDEVRLYSADYKATYRARLTGPNTADWIATL